MKHVICILLAYLLGSLSPAALIGKIKRKNLRKEGTGNLGATNITLVFGKMLGFLVMIFDILKGFLAVKLSALIIPEAEWFHLLAGFSAVLGHCFPFYLKFKGGKGLAAFGGAILAYHPLLFLFVLTTGVVIMLIVNSGVALTYYAALTIPVHALLAGKSLSTIAVSAALSLFMMVMFLPNLKRAIRGQDKKSRDFLKKQLGKGEES